jgi:hypothetical protein
MRSPFDKRRLVRLRTRGRWGVQAGIMAGMAVAMFFFVVDLVRSAPLATPLLLAHTVLERAGLVLEKGGVLETLAGSSAGGHLLVFTAIHLALFSAVGVLAAGMANLFHVRWNAKTGAAAGLVVGVLAWLGATTTAPALLAGGHLTRELVVGAAVVGGTVLGWHLRLCRLDAEDDSGNRGPGSHR